MMLSRLDLDRTLFAPLKSWTSYFNGSLSGPGLKTLVINPWREKMIFINIFDICWTSQTLWFLKDRSSLLQSNLYAREFELELSNSTVSSSRRTIPFWKCSNSNTPLFIAHDQFYTKLENWVNSMVEKESKKLWVQFTLRILQRLLLGELS